MEKAYAGPFVHQRAYQAWLCGCHEACAREILKRTTKGCGEGGLSTYVCRYMGAHHEDSSSLLNLSKRRELDGCIFV